MRVALTVAPDDTRIEQRPDPECGPGDVVCRVLACATCGSDVGWYVSRKLPAVLDCHLVAGDFDYFLKIRVSDIADFNRLHGSRLIALPGVRQTRTFFVMKEVVDNAPLDF